MLSPLRYNFAQQDKLRWRMLVGESNIQRKLFARRTLVANVGPLHLYSFYCLKQRPVYNSHFRPSARFVCSTIFDSALECRRQV